MAGVVLTEGAALLGQVAKRHLEQDADAVGAGDGRDGSLDVAAIGIRPLPGCLGGELGGEDDAGGVVYTDGGIAAFLEHESLVRGVAATSSGEARANRFLLRLGDPRRRQC